MEVNEFKYEWCGRFIAMLEQAGVDEETISLAKKLMMDERNEFSHTKMSKSPFNQFNVKKSRESAEDFFNYLERLANEKGRDYIKTFLTETVQHIAIMFDEYEKLGKSEKTNFLNLFLKQLIKERPQDIKVETFGCPMKDISEKTGDGTIEIVIAGVSIGHICFGDYVIGAKTIDIIDFRTLPGMERLGLGGFLFNKFCRQLKDERPGYVATAVNVMEGRDGEKAYEKWGAKQLSASDGGEVKDYIFPEEAIDKAAAQAGKELSFNRKLKSK